MRGIEAPLVELSDTLQKSDRRSHGSDAVESPISAPIRGGRVCCALAYRRRSRFVRFGQWWAGLTDAQRADVLAVESEVPEWIVASLVDAGITTISAEMVDVAELSGYRHVELFSAAMADFLSRKGR